MLSLKDKNNKVLIKLNIFSCFWEILEYIKVIQPTDIYITCAFGFNITTTCIMNFQNKCTHFVAWFTPYMTDIIPLTHSKISPSFCNRAILNWLKPKPSSPDQNLRILSNSWNQHIFLKYKHVYPNTFCQRTQNFMSYLC